MQIITPRCFSHHVTFYSKHQRGNSNKQTNKQTNKRTTKKGLCITDAGNAFKLASESTCKDVVQYHLYAEHKTQTK